MSLLADVSASYDAAAKVSVYVVFVEAGELAVIAQAQSEIYKLVADGDEDLRTIAELLRNVRFRLATNLLPANHPMLGLRELSADLASQVAELPIASRAGATAVAAAEALARLLMESESPLGSAALEVLATEQEDRRLVVLRYQRAVAATEAYLAERGVTTSVCSRASVRAQPLAGTMLLVGDPRLFRSATWTAGRAESVCFVQYPLAPRPTAPGGLFGAAGGLVAPSFRLSGATDPVPDTEFFDPDIAIVEAGQREAIRRRSERPDSVEAALLLLEDDHAVWTAVGEGRFMWVVDLDDPTEPAVSQTPTASVRQGSFLVFRDEGATGSLIQAIADTEFDALVHRPAQTRWKAALSSATSHAGGPAAARRLLVSLGAKSPNPAGWAAAESIRPNSRHDFGITCDFAGLGDEADELWAALSAVKRAHAKAGMWVRRRLEEALVAQQLETLKTEGVLHLDLPGLGQLSAYRVLHVHPEREYVDPMIIDQPFGREP